MIGEGGSYIRKKVGDRPVLVARTKEALRPGDQPVKPAPAKATVAPEPTKPVKTEAKE